MRTAFIDELSRLAAVDERIWLLTGDLGFTVLEDYAEKFADRYINMGIAEQNMIGVAAGLAASGAIPFVYSIANFPIMRCLEQIRNDVCYHNLPVKIVAVGGGFTYAAYGYTHFGVEDLAVLRPLPHMTILSPGDPMEAQVATRAIAADPGPGYLRLGRAGETVLHETSPDLTIGRPIVLRKGRDGTLLATGSILNLAVQAADTLAAHGMNISVMSAVSISPFDPKVIEDMADRPIITLEEHGRGGLGSIIAEILAGMGGETPFKTLFMDGEPPKTAGNHDYMRTLFGLTEEAIVKNFLALRTQQNR